MGVSMFNWRDWSGHNARLAQARKEKRLKQNGRSSPKQVAVNTLHTNKEKKNEDD
jgi:hypothetical protein